MFTGVYDAQLADGNHPERSDLFWHSHYIKRFT